MHIIKAATILLKENPRYTVDTLTVQSSWIFFKKGIIWPKLRYEKKRSILNIFAKAYIKTFWFPKPTRFNVNEDIKRKPDIKMAAVRTSQAGLFHKTGQNLEVKM